MSVRPLDRLKIRFITWTRYMNSAAIQRWSRRTFRRLRVQTTVGLPLQRARDHYHSSQLPETMMVPRKIAEAALPLSYMLPYYYFIGAVFKVYRRFPVGPDAEWTPGDPANRAFPRNQEGWDDAQTDEAFARLRLQGPNPFLLKAIGEGRFEVDYAPFFKGIHDPVVCTFVLEDGILVAESIKLGERIVPRGGADWERAKLIANALDARYCVFTRHLADTHLFIGQAFALSMYSLPTHDPLRAFLSFFTYGTLVVNDFAFKLLLTPASYFLQSNFIHADDAMKLFHNSMAFFSLDDLVVPMDVKKRGIDRIPNHPYVQDGLEAWHIFAGFVRGYLAPHYADDAAVAADAALHAWYARLASLLPNHDITDKPLRTLDQLVSVLGCLLYNNVSHEVCSDFSPYVMSQDPEHKRLVNLSRLQAGRFDEPVALADVFLFDQGAYAGRFNNGGNNMLTLNVDEHIADPGLRRAVAALQADLHSHNAKLIERNKSRPVPYRMMPRQWEVSISF